MKKIRYVIAAMLIISALVVGCGSKEPQSATFTINQSGVEMEMVVDAEGDKITKLTQTSTLDLSAYSEDQIAAIEAEVDKASTEYKDTDGVSYNSETSGGILTETVEISINDDNLGDIISQGIVPIDGDDDVDYLSFDATRESLADAGWTVE